MIYSEGHLIIEDLIEEIPYEKPTTFPALQEFFLSEIWLLQINL